MSASRQTHSRGHHDSAAPVDYHFQPIFPHIGTQHRPTTNLELLAARQAAVRLLNLQRCTCAALSPGVAVVQNALQVRLPTPLHHQLLGQMSPLSSLSHGRTVHTTQHDKTSTSCVCYAPRLTNRDHRTLAVTQSNGCRHHPLSPSPPSRTLPASPTPPPPLLIIIIIITNHNHRR